MELISGIGTELKKYIKAHANFAFIKMSKNLIGFCYHPPEEKKKWRKDVELQDLVRYRIQFNEDIESKWMLSGILTGVDGKRRRSVL